MDDLELREALAREVFGYEPEHFNKTLVRTEPVGEIDFTVPAYESTYEGMGLVIERMREMHYYVMMNTVPAGAYAVFRRAVDDPDMIDPSVGPKFEGYADDIFCAVALAALAAARSEK